MKDLSKEYQDDMKKQIMHLKEQYNKTLMVGIGWISTQSRFFQDKTDFSCLKKTGLTKYRSD